MATFSHEGLGQEYGVNLWRIRAGFDCVWVGIERVLVDVALYLDMSM